MKSIKIFLNSRLLDYWKFLAIILIFSIFFFLRLYHLGYHNFWYDEVGTVNYAKAPWHNWNAPLYWMLLHFWIKIFRISEFSLRFPSLIFSFLTVVLVFLLGKALFNKKVGIIASFLIGLSPFHLWYAQEARDYSMALFFGTLSSYLLFRAVKEERLKLWLFFILVSIIGLYTNYFYLFLFLTQGIYIIFLKRLKLNFKEIICFLIVVLWFLPYLSKFLSKFYFVWQGFWIPKPTWGSLIITLENFILGYNGSSALYFISDILAGIFLISAILALRKGEFKQAFIACIFLFFIPVICALFFSRMFFSIYLDRGLIIFSPYYFIVLALGIASLNKITRVFIFAILISIMFIGDYRYFSDLMIKPSIHHVGTCTKKPVKPIAEFLDTNVDLKEDIVAFTHVCIMSTISFYSKDKPSSFYYFFDPQFPDTNWRRPIPESRRYVLLHKISLLKFRKLWVVFSDWQRSGELDKNSQSVKDWLSRNFKLEFIKGFDGLWVSRYVKN